ncbi:MAG: peroxide stress protein YaaA [Acidimicrobiales bacterium]
MIRASGTTFSSFWCMRPFGGRSHMLGANRGGVKTRRRRITGRRRPALAPPRSAGPRYRGHVGAVSARHRIRRTPVLCVVSPAKSLDYESPLATKKRSEPMMLERAGELVTIMRTKSVDDLRQLMSISQPLAELNFERFQDWEPPFTPKNARPAVLAFNGDTYQGLDAANRFTERDFTHAQKTLRILSGLYGVLRPLDLIQPYRLEMGSKVANRAGRDLYAYWRPTVTEQLNSDLAASPGANALINLASTEYFGAVDTAAVDGKVVTPIFLDADADGEYRTVGFFAKRARGTMAGWIITERIKSVRALREFTGMGYRFDPERSTTDQPVFVRSGQ